MASARAHHARAQHTHRLHHRYRQSHTFLLYTHHSLISLFLCAEGARALHRASAQRLAFPAGCRAWGRCGAHPAAAAQRRPRQQLPSRHRRAASHQPDRRPARAESIALANPVITVTALSRTHGQEATNGKRQRHRSTPGPRCGGRCRQSCTTSAGRRRRRLRRAMRQSRPATTWARSRSTLRAWIPSAPWSCARRSWRTAASRWRRSGATRRRSPTGLPVRRYDRRGRARLSARRRRCTGSATRKRQTHRRGSQQRSPCLKRTRKMQRASRG